MDPTTRLPPPSQLRQSGFPLPPPTAPLPVLSPSAPTHRLAQLTGDAALLAGGVAAQHMLATEPRAQRALLEWIVDLRGVRGSRVSSRAERGTRQGVGNEMRVRVPVRLASPDGALAPALAPACALTVTGRSKKTFRVRARPRQSSVRNSVLALSSSTPARSLGASRCGRGILLGAQVGARALQACGQERPGERAPGPGIGRRPGGDSNRLGRAVCSGWVRGEAWTHPRAAQLAPCRASSLECPPPGPPRCCAGCTRAP